ncbi:glycine betaine ABC transporter substrate-binding protein [Streptomyces oceani]|uniref:Glycine/betaine ABC transporter substrate-binding protein n=1 Tax=Streptomyces oceani TaxID=1075402 RepID=A0A1E7JXM8_9ACTN|nr:glycine betaine ABC transporter substrate-binding protein [Streptomyces oceani]OEU96432.1 glycine/betaine ABC transporter substrate-binding protein [Streptomyces oceani]
MPRTGRTRSLLAVLPLLALTACGEAQQQDDRSPITLVNPTWSNGQANVAVAAEILEKELDYDVKVVKLDSEDAWKALHKGKADAILEDWGHPDLEKKYVNEKKTVVSAGDMGFEGHIGWYVPEYLANKHPDIINWKNLNRYAHLFRTAETGKKGRLLEGSPKFVTRDDDIIRSLDLNYETVYAGSEKAQIEEMRKRAKKREPFLTYWWRPHWISTEIKLVQVNLPMYSSGCASNEHNASCGYPESELRKYFNADFAEEREKPAQLLKNMNWSEEDQNQVAGEIAGGTPPREAAREWVKDSEAVWRTWFMGV